MTRLWVLSDIHIETEGNVDLLAHAPQDWDALVVAGDVHTPGWRAMYWLSERFPGCRVIYVPGNHDRWTGRTEHWTADELDAEGRAVAQQYGFEWLDRDSVDVNGVDVHGCTLWTDLRLGYHHVPTAHAMARRGMNDYRRIRRRRSGPHHYVRPEDTLSWHRRDLAWLGTALTEPTGQIRVRPAVVVTHHAPSPLCLQDPHDSLAHCYASDLRPFIEAHRPDAWVHGHVHHAVDHEEGVTQVVANGRGRGAEARDWRPGLVVELPKVSAAMQREVHART